MRLDGSHWDDRALAKLGARRIEFIADPETGAPTAVEVSPDLPLASDGAPTGYAAALAEAMADVRQAAFAAAMEFGNRITAKVVGVYSDVEARTWPLQRTQADTVLGGGELPPDALLIKLAARRGVTLEAFATIVQHKAQAFEAIADVGQGLRLGAEGLRDPALDTQAKIDAAVEALRVKALEAAAELGLTV